MKRIIPLFMALFCSFFLLVSSLRAQELTPVFENITEGLPSTEVHDMFQDSIGYMWFATDRGICRYNGDEMKIIDTDKDIPTNVFFKFFKQSETKVWLVAKNLQLYWFNPTIPKPKFHALKQNKSLADFARKSKFTVNVSTIRFEEEGLVILLRQAPGYILVGNDGSCEWVHSQEDCLITLNHINLVDLNIVSRENYFYTQLVPIAPEQHQNYLHVGSDSIQIDKNSKTFFNINFGVAASINFKSINYLGVSNYLIRTSNKKTTILEIPSVILSILPFNDQLLVGTYDGVFIVSKNFEIESTFLKGLCITKLFTGDSNTIWVSTLQEGVFVSENSLLRNLKIKGKERVTTIFHLEGNILVYDDVAKHIFFLNKKNGQWDEVQNVVIFANLIRTENPKILKYISKNPISNFEKIPNSTYQFSLNNENSPNYFVTKKKIYHLQGDIYKLVRLRNEQHHPNFVFEIDNQKIVLGTDYGLYYINPKTKTIRSAPITNSANISFKNYVVLGGNEYILSNQGIHYFQNKMLKVLPLEGQAGLKNIYKQNETTAWLYSDSKIYCLKIKDGLPVLIQKAVYSSHDKEAMIQSIITQKDELWISTKKGIFITKIDAKNQSETRSPIKFKLDSISLNSQLVNHFSVQTIFTDDDLTLYFDLICLDHTIPRLLEYSLDGKKWLAMNKNSVTLANLRSDDYTFLVRSVYDPSKTLFSLPIHVSKIWYQSNWFIGLCSMLIMIFVVFMIFQFFKSRDKKRSAELDKLNLELKLLTSKMNPHFTFNTINSIQYYILKSDKKEAIQYLSDFALLIRKSLDFSMAERITIEDEIHFLSLYVKMENKRFDSNFRLKFDLDPPNIVQRKKIPSMLIQPLVENIILHAGYSEDEDKLINIKIVHAHSFFTIEVIDHGKGIQAKDDFNKHKSYGIDILKSRVKIYNGREFSESDVKLHSSEKGTIVTIKLKEWKQY